MMLKKPSSSGFNYQATGAQHLSFHKVCCTVNKRPLLCDVSGFIQRGEVLAVMGPSGCGKTTLLSILAGRVDAPKATGEIALHSITSSQSVKCDALSDNNNKFDKDNDKYDNNNNNNKYDNNHNHNSMELRTMKIEPVTFSLSGCGMVGFVSQQPALAEHMTTYDFLVFCSRLRSTTRPVTSPPSSSSSSSSSSVNSDPPDKRAENLIESTLVDLRLQHVRDSLIANLSTGEKKRVSIAVDALLLGNSAVFIFLDEPTTGLSATEASQLMTILQQLAREKGYGIVVTVHQPRRSIFLENIDRLLILNPAPLCSAVYFGKPAQMSSFFAAHGVPLPEMGNPADAVMQELEKMSGDELLAFGKAVSLDNQQCRATCCFADGRPAPKMTSRLSQDAGFPARAPPALFSFAATMILVPHYFRLVMSAKRLWLLPLLVQFIQATVTSFLFFQIGTTTLQARDRVSIIGLLIGMGPFSSGVWASVIHDQRERIEKEMSLGYYGIDAHLAWMLLLFVRTFFVMLVMVPAYFIVGLQLNAVDFFTFFLCFYMLSMIQVSFLQLIMLLVSNISAGITYYALILFLHNVTAGFIVRKESMANPVPYLVPFSPNHAAIENAAVSQIQGLTFSCPAGTNASTDMTAGSCPMSGVEFLASQDFQNEMLFDFGVLLAWYGLAVVCQLFFAWRRCVAFQKPSCQSVEELKPTIHSVPFGNAKEFSSFHSLPDYPSMPDLTEEPEPVENYPRNSVHRNSLAAPAVGEFSINLPPSPSPIPTHISEGASRSLNLLPPSRSLSPLPSPSLSDSVSDVELIPLANKRSTFVWSCEYTLKFDHVFFQVDQKTIISDVWGQLQPGVLAVMGSSGAGKTTLLRILAMRMDFFDPNTQGRFGLAGEQIVLPLSCNQDIGSRNKQEALLRAWAHSCAFIPSKPQFPEQLTVREILMEAARLQLPSLLKDEFSQRVDDILSDLGLESCQNTRASSISGGERIRVSVGINALMVRRPVIFLDEPTSGLSSADATRLMSVLHGRCIVRGWTVVLTIHQPRMDVFTKFIDRVLLLKKTTILFGPSSKLMSDLIVIKSRLEQKAAAAEQDIFQKDHLLEVVQGRSRATSTALLRASDYHDHPEALMDWLTSSTPEKLQGVAAASLEKHERTPPRSKFSDQSLAGNLAEVKIFESSTWSQLSALFRRYIMCIVRNPMPDVGIFLSCIFLGGLRGLIFSQIPHQTATAQDVFGAVEIGVSFFFFIVNSLVYNYRNSYGLVREEVQSGKYNLSSIVFVEAVVQTVRIFLLTVVYGSTFYFLLGFLHDPNVIFQWFSVLWLGAIVIDSLGLLLASLLGFAGSQAVFSSLLSFMQTLDGFFVRLFNLPVFAAWLSFLSVNRYTLEQQIRLSFTGSPYLAAPGVDLDGSTLVTSFGYSTSSTTVYLEYFGLALVFLIARILIYFVYRWNVVVKNVPVSRITGS